MNDESALRDPSVLQDHGLDAAERGLELNVSLLKARREGRDAAMLRRPLSGARRPGQVDCPPAAERPALPGTRDQELLFEQLREAASAHPAGWDCTIEGGGDALTVRLVGPSSGRVVWSSAGPPARVVNAFDTWLSTHPVSRE